MESDAEGNLLRAHELSAFWRNHGADSLFARNTPENFPYPEIRLEKAVSGPFLSIFEGFAVFLPQTRKAYMTVDPGHLYNVNVLHPAAPKWKGNVVNRVNRHVPERGIMNQSSIRLVSMCGVRRTQMTWNRSGQ